MSATPRPGAAQGAHRGRVLERAAHDLADPAHALRVAREHRDHPEVVQQPLGRHRAGAHAMAHDRRVPVHGAGREHVHGGHHRPVLGGRVHAERHRRRRRRREDALAAGEHEGVGPVAAAAALDVERVPGAARGHGDRVLDGEQLVHAVGVHGQLHVVRVREIEGAAQLLGPGAHVLVDLEPAAAGAQRVLGGPGARRRRPHEQARVERDAPRAPPRSRAAPPPDCSRGSRRDRSPGSRASSGRRRARRRRSAARASGRGCRQLPASRSGRARRRSPWRCRARRRSRPSCPGCPRGRPRRPVPRSRRCSCAARRAPGRAGARP